MIRRRFGTVFDTYVMAVLFLIAVAYGVYQFLSWLLRL